jgi:plasmid stabilization system protein ParE
MTYHDVVQPRAERDIQIAAHWNLGQSGSLATALRWARKLRAKIATLKTSPQRCPIDPDSEVYGEEVRVLLYGKSSRRVTPRGFSYVLPVSDKAISGNS